MTMPNQQPTNTPIKSIGALDGWLIIRNQLDGISHRQQERQTQHDPTHYTNKERQRLGYADGWYGRG